MPLFHVTANPSALIEHGAPRHVEIDLEGLIIVPVGERVGTLAGKVSVMKLVCTLAGIVLVLPDTV